MLTVILLRWLIAAICTWAIIGSLASKNNLTKYERI